MANTNSSAEKLRHIPEAAETKTEKRETNQERALELALAIGHHLQAQREAAEGVRKQTEHTLGTVAKLSKEQGDAAQQAEVALIKAELTKGATAYANPVGEISKKLDAARAKIAAADEGDIEMGDEDIVSAEPSYEGATKRALEKAKLVAKDLSDRKSRNDKIIRELNPSENDLEIAKIAAQERDDEVEELLRAEATENAKQIFAERTKQFETGKNKQIFAERTQQFEKGKINEKHQKQFAEEALAERNAEVDQLLRDEVATDADKKALITEATSFDDLKNTLKKIADYGTLSKSNKKEYAKVEIMRLVSALDQIRIFARKNPDINWKRAPYLDHFTRNLGLRDKVVLLAEQAQRAAFALKNKDVKYDKLASTDSVQVDESLDADRMDPDAKQQEAAADDAANDFRKKLEARRAAQGHHVFTQNKLADQGAEAFAKKLHDRHLKEQQTVEDAAESFHAKLAARKEAQTQTEQAERKAKTEESRNAYKETRRVERIDQKAEKLQTNTETKIDEETPRQVRQAEEALMERVGKNKNAFMAELKQVRPKLDAKMIVATGQIFDDIYNKNADRSDIAAQLALSMAGGVSEGQIDQVLAFLKEASPKFTPSKGEISAWISSHAEEMKDEMDESGETARQEKIAADKKKTKDTEAKTADAGAKKREAAQERAEAKVWNDVLDAMDKQYMAKGWSAEQQKYGPHGSRDAATDPTITKEALIGAAMALIESGKTLEEAQKAADKIRPTFRYMPDASHMAEAQRRLTAERAAQPPKKPGFFGRLFGRGK